jgi:Flp pilus assembly protein TadG
MKTVLKFRHLGCPGKREDDEAAQALVELSLILPLFFLLMIGAVELGRVAFAAIEISNAARAGAQYGAQSAFYSQDTSGITATAQNDANDIYIINPTNFSVSSAIGYICSDGTAATSSGNNSASCSSPTATVEQILTVNTQVSFDPLFHIRGMASTFTLRGRSVQKVLLQ